MMDYYEELGVGRSASVVEIRQAYRRLMRLLHPDHCSDQAGRRLAELQARRLNAVLAVLTDPVERQRYDCELSFDRAAPPRLHPPRTSLTHAPRWIWPVAGVLAMLALISMLPAPPRSAPAMEPPAPPAGAVAVPQKAALPAPPSHRLAAPGGGSMPKAAETAGPQAAEIPLAVPRLPPESPPASGPPARMWEPPALAEPASADPPHPPPVSALEGEWLFLPESAVTPNGLYPPEYIELRITERAGAVCGKYRARYHINDRAISPNVTFEFEGRAGEKDARLPWSGPGGSRGEVTLHLLTTGALEVTWVVSRLGNELRLISGTATLVRRIE